MYVKKNQSDLIVLLRTVLNDRMGDFCILRNCVDIGNLPVC
jgi:hypothetical protein